VTADQVRAITDMVHRDEPIARIARITGLSRPTIYRVLQNGERKRRTA